MSATATTAQEQISSDEYIGELVANFPTLSDAHAGFIIGLLVEQGGDGLD